MEIDKRIQGKRPLTCFDTTEAKKYLNQKGYFADSMSNFIDLKRRCYYGTLDVADESFCPYHLAGDDYYTLFLPEEFCVPEKKYEPYVLSEFLQDFKLGEPIKFRNKKNGDAFYQIFLGYCQYNDGEEGTVYVSLGSKNYRLRELFEDYEVFLNGAFRVFGRCD